MDAQPETTISIDEKHSFNWRLFILWPFLTLLLYVLSFGPVLTMLASNRLDPSVEDALKTVYYPVWMAYSQTLLHKPLGVYMHLWVPKVIDKNGDELDP
jgi:hypothetical protein